MATDIGRREFISVLGVAAVACPLAARAQQPALPVIGFVNAASPRTYARQLSAYLKGLSEVGYVNGNNVVGELLFRTASFIVGKRRYGSIASFARLQAASALPSIATKSVRVTNAAPGH